MGLTVPDLTSAIDFFVEVLGAQHVFTHGPYASTPETSASLGRPTDSYVSGIAMVHVGSTNIELLQIGSPWSRHDPPRPDDAGGHHLALYVDDIDGAVVTLASSGVDVLAGPMPLPGPESGHGGRFIFFRAPWGIMLELVSYPHGKAYVATTERRLHDPRTLPQIID